MPLRPSSRDPRPFPPPVLLLAVLRAQMLLVLALSATGVDAAILERAVDGGKLAECSLPDVEGEAFCGTLDVYEDRAAGRGRRIGLRVAVLAALTDAPQPDPVFVFSGGPGQASSEFAGDYAHDLAVARQKRDVVLIDRRGTGSSHPLDCPPPGPNERRYDPDRVWQCRQDLSQRADLYLYTTPIAVDDFDEVREWLGYERIHLVGGSYGSREAMVYLRRHPERIKTAVLWAVTPPDERALESTGVYSQRALDRLFDDCVADAGCRAAFAADRPAALADELAEVLARLERQPALIDVETAAGEAAERTATRNLFGGLVRMFMISPFGAAQVPYLIHRTHRGDYGPLGTILGRSAAAEAGISMGLFLSVVCAEEINVTDLDALSRGRSFWGESWVRSIAGACRTWPLGELPGDFFEPVESAVPVLMVNGWLDPTAPPSVAAEAARHLPNARLVVVREGHHNFPWEDCVGPLVADFFDRASAADLDASCVEMIRRPAFYTPGSS